jgi:hypothetical protein
MVNYLLRKALDMVTAILVTPTLGKKRLLEKERLYIII